MVREIKMSRIGKMPVPLPSGVEVTLGATQINVKGPKGSLSTPAHPKIAYEKDGDRIVVSRVDDSRLARAQHGLRRTLLANAVQGVAKGFSKTLEVVGVGYKVQVKGKKVVLNVGYSHPVEMEMPGGVEAGAEEVHATINGIGERAGNASLEEVALSLHALYGVETGLNLKEIYKTSRLVSKLTGIPVPPNKAVVGDNAFAHESGIHTAGVVSSPDTYEPLPPELVGRERRIVAGKHAGKKGIEAMLEELGFELTGEQLAEVVARVKHLGDKGRAVTEGDLKDIAEAVAGSVSPSKRRIALEDLLVVTGNKVTPTATVRLTIDGKPYKNSDYGVGPIDAALKAIQGIVGGAMKFRLAEFRLEATSGGSDALANVMVKVVDEGGRAASGRGISEDIVMAGVEAVMNAANRLLRLRARH